MRPPERPPERVVRIDRVTTRGGDGGQTSLGDGRRVAKDDARVDAYGEVDEANATLGLLRAAIPARPELDRVLARLQNALFDIGGELAVPSAAGRVGEATLALLEAESAAMNAALPPLTSFVLPAGRDGAAAAHLARTVVRRAERRVVALAARETVSPVILRTLNRLSDYLFVLARHLNAGQDELWVPGERR